MGMSFGATVCVGVKVQEGYEELNQDFINERSEEEENQGGDFYFVDYLYNALEEKYEIVTGGTDDWESTVVAIKSTVQEANWNTEHISIVDLIVIQDAIDEIKKDLEKLGVKCGESGTFLVPYFSH